MKASNFRVTSVFNLPTALNKSDVIFEWPLQFFPPYHLQLPIYYLNEWKFRLAYIIKLTLVKRFVDEKYWLSHRTAHTLTLQHNINFIIFTNGYSKLRTCRMLGNKMFCLCSTFVVNTIFFVFKHSDFVDRSFKLIKGTARHFTIMIFRSKYL